jgi:hypothetical protein
MNRKLHNSLTALMISGAVLMLALVTAAPAPSGMAPSGMEQGTAMASTDGTVVVAMSSPRADQARQVRPRQIKPRQIKPSQIKPSQVRQIETLTDAIGLTAEVAVATALSAAFEETRETETGPDKEPANRASNRQRNNRQALLMPYFSFAPRG